MKPLGDCYHGRIDEPYPRINLHQLRRAAVVLVSQRLDRKFTGGDRFDKSAFSGGSQADMQKIRYFG